MDSHPDGFPGSDFPPEMCSHCGREEFLHFDGTCPTVDVSSNKQSEQTINGVKTVAATASVHEVEIVRGNPAKLASGRAPRSPGRPPGEGPRSHASRRAAKAEKLVRKAAVEKIIGKGFKALDQALEIRIPIREGAPNRTVAECKDATLRLLNGQLWTIEGVAESEGLSETDEARLLKLLAGFNAALPKTTEEPERKPLEEMTEDELVRADKGETIYRDKKARR